MAGTAILIVTLLLLALLVSGVWVVLTSLAWKKAQQDPAEKKRRGPLMTTTFNCCGIVLAVVGLLSLLAMIQLRSDVSLFQYNPWADLDLESGTSDAAAIKRAYRKLSLKFHPDKPDGDAKRFQKISRAYDTLSDPKSMKNFQEYGNPEGTYLNLAEMPEWLSSANSGLTKEEAKKRSAKITIGVLLAFLIAVPFAGQFIVNNRKALNVFETGGHGGDRVESLARSSTAPKRREMLRRLKVQYDNGEIETAEYDEMKELVLEADERAAEISATESGSKKPKTPKKD